jgi:hypothetical protein
MIAGGALSAEGRHHLTDAGSRPLLARILPGRADFTTPVVALVVANIIPLVGVVLFGWSAGELVFLYWAENVIVGFWNLMRMLTARDNDSVGCGGRAFISIFFCVHFGGFCAGHGFFVWMIIGMAGGDALECGWEWLLLPLAGLFVSHGISFARDFIIGGERLRVKIGNLMIRPYSRIVMLHVGIIAGAMPVMLLGSPLPLLVLLIAFKVGIDIKLHVKSHARGAGEEGGKSEAGATSVPSGANRS